MLQKNNMLSKFTKHQSWSSKIETDMSVESSDSEEDIVHQTPERWWQNGLKKSLEILKEFRVSCHRQLDLLSNQMYW